MSTEKKIQDYLHLYLGCEVMAGTHRCKLIGIEDGAIVMHSISGRHVILFANIKPILRCLSDMTEQEMQECGNMEYDFSDDPDLNKWEPKDFEIGLSPRQFAWLLSKHFDLFDLIPDGLAIDKSTLKQPQ
jgi:hypothetical protein